MFYVNIRFREARVGKHRSIAIVLKASNLWKVEYPGTENTVREVLRRTDKNLLVRVFCVVSSGRWAHSGYSEAISRTMVVSMNTYNT